MLRVKDYVHNLGEAIADCIDEHSHCVDVRCPRDTKIIHEISELCEDYVHVCKFVEKFCDHHDGTLYHMEECHSGGGLLPTRH